ncbi:MAG: MBL fold metallo-hydrolase [Chitinispirillaceae bacterium]|nr:MBL fold metallo-hydrolase [Chitinispirillaceae bacterium]
MIKDLSVTILVDNRASENGAGTEHGLSLWIEADGFRLLFDTGQSDLMFRNGQLAGIDPAEADVLVLSHGHYDHTGGVGSLLELRKDLPVYCHPGVVIPRYSRQSDGCMKPVGMSRSSAMALMNREKNIIWVTRPQYITGHIGIVGVIPRTTDFEDTGGAFFGDPSGQSADPIEDDTSLWIETVRGIVVVTGCCHSGIVNTLLRIRQITGNNQFYRIIGGFHLVNAARSRLDATVAYLQAERWDRMVPCHCTGEVAMRYLEQYFPDRMEAGFAGKEIR